MVKNSKILFLNAINESHRKAVNELKKHQLQHCGGADIEFISSGELLSLCLYYHKYQGNPKCFFVFKVQEIPRYCMEIPPVVAILGISFQSVCLLVSVQMVQGCEFWSILILCSISTGRWTPDLTFILVLLQLGAKSLQCVEELVLSSFSTQIHDFSPQKFYF